MDWYHTWIYTHVINSNWFLWSVVIIIFAFNFIAPILMWLIMSSNISFKKKKSN